MKKKKWLEGVQLELENYEKRGVWKRVEVSEIGNRKLIGSKWVFKLKIDGRYRSRLVALRYSQIPGVDFTENYSPVNIRCGSKNSIDHTNGERKLRNTV